MGKKLSSSQHKWGKLELYASDIHFPYHDPTAWKLFLTVAAALEPSIVVLGGDVVDFYSISDFLREPARRLILQDELDEAAKALGDLRKVSEKSVIYYQEGNHETRLTRYLHRHAPELSALRGLTMPELLGFKQLGVKWVPQGEDFKIGDLWHLHGDEMGGGGALAAARMLRRIPGNMLMGHWHQIQAAYQRTLNGSLHGAWVNGCLCSLNPEYVVKPQWQQGFTLVNHATSGLFHVDQIPLFKNEQDKLSCFVHGKLYS